MTMQWWCLVIFLLTLAGCGKSEESASSAPATTTRPAVVLGYSAPDLAGGQVVILEGLRQRALERGWKVVVMNANFNEETQAQQIAKLLELQVTAIVAVPVHSEKIAASMEAAQQAGVWFYTIDRAPTRGQVAMTVQSNNVLAGQQAGAALVEALQKRYGQPRGVVLELQGELTQNVAQQRGQGFHEIVDKHPAIRVISRETHWMPDEFAQHTRTVLGQETIDAIYLHSDVIGVPVVLPILQQMGKLVQREGEGSRGRGVEGSRTLDAATPFSKSAAPSSTNSPPATSAPSSLDPLTPQPLDPSSQHIIIVGVDGGSSALQAIRAGYMDQASSQPLNDFGIVVEWIAKKLAGEKMVAQEVVRPGASWSPGQLKETPGGWLLELRTVAVTSANVEDPTLWGNQLRQTPTQVK